MKKSEGEGWTLIRALFRLYLREWIILIFVIVFFVFLFDMFPILVGLNIDYFENHRDDLERGILMFLLTLVVSIVHRLTFSQFLYRFMELGIRLSNVITMIVYHKALKYSPMADKEFSEA